MMNIDEYFADSYGYGPLEEAGFTKEDVREIVRWYDGENDYESWWAVLILSDGRYAGVEAWCDYTGWDCQAGSEVVYASSEAGIISELTTEGRRRLGYEDTPDVGV
jgi:hypothetical protein